MNLEGPAAPAAAAIGTLQCCLVEADPASERRARWIKRRAVLLSIAVQSLMIVGLILYPLLGKSERISLRNVTPVPPFRAVHHPANPGAQPMTPRPRPCVTCWSNVRPVISTTASPSPEPNGPDTGPEVPGAPEQPGIDHAFAVDPHPVAPPPQQERPAVTERRRVSELQQMAQLVRRVEPAYPPLARTTHQEGRVELRAIIATDGTIQSLTVVSGHPLFIQSALAAVREWRYRPTILNGSPIEVETSITVIYTLGH